MTKVNHFRYATPRQQRLREFVRHKQGVALFLGFVAATSIAILCTITYPATQPEQTAKESPQAISIEQAKRLARQSYRNGYFKGGMQQALTGNGLETFEHDSITFEPLIRCSINQMLEQ